MIYLNDHIKDFNFEESLPLLSKQRREQALKFRNDLGRCTCAAAYLLLCEGLQREYGMMDLPIFEYGEHGKPFIKGNPDIHFNMSHCREAVICVLSDAPVGVDVESVRTLNESLVRYTMNDGEQQEIFHSDRSDIAFTRFWTMKEAVLKCSGEGLTRDLKTVLAGVSGIETVVSPDLRYVYSICRC